MGSEAHSSRRSADSSPRGERGKWEVQQQENRCENTFQAQRTPCGTIRGGTKLRETSVISPPHRLVGSHRGPAETRLRSSRRKQSASKATTFISADLGRDEIAGPHSAFYLLLFKFRQHFSFFFLGLNKWGGVFYWTFLAVRKKLRANFFPPRRLRRGCEHLQLSRWDEPSTTTHFHPRRWSHSRFKASSTADYLTYFVPQYSHGGTEILAASGDMRDAGRLCLSA